MSNKDKFYESYEISTYTPESDQCESVNRNVQYFNTLRKYRDQNVDVNNKKDRNLSYSLYKILNKITCFIGCDPLTT